MKSHLTNVAVLLSLLATCQMASAAGTFSTATLTGDADSTIAATKAYTLAIDVAGVPNVNVNGSVFTGSGVVSNPSTNNYSFTNGPALVTTSTVANSVTGSVGGMLDNFNYNDTATNETLTLKNLRVGETYRTTFYNRSWSGPGGRTQTITTSDGGSTTFDPDAGAQGTGSLLKYDFVAQSNSLTFTFSPQNFGSPFIQAAFSNEMPRYNALLTDNFYAPSNPDTMNVNFNLAARQGGPYAGTTYTPYGNNQVGNTFAIDGGNYLLSANNANTALNRNWNGSLSAGGQLIAFDMAPNAGGASSDNWSAISLGFDEASKNAWVTSAAPHLSLIFRGNGELVPFDGSTGLSAASWTNLTNVTSDLHRIELLLTDPTDSNPFDGIGSTKVDVFADGQFVYSYTKTGGGYANNYVSFTGSSIGGVDNLLIAQVAVPEPSSLVLAALGVAGLLRMVCRHG